jgi:hypothetical protein
MLVSAASSSYTPVRRCFSLERSVIRTFSVGVLHRGDPTPSLLDAFVRTLLRCARFWSGGGTPHDALLCHVLGAAPCLVPFVFRPSRRVFPLEVDVCVCPGLIAPHRPMDMASLW